jgi:hypothetical protein
VCGEMSCTVAWDVVWVVKCRGLWRGMLCVGCSVVYCGLGCCVSGEVSCTVAWDVVCPVKCRVLWLGMLCVR